MECVWGLYWNANVPKWPQAANTDTIPSGLLWKTCYPSSSTQQHKGFDVKMGRCWGRGKMYVQHRWEINCIFLGGKVIALHKDQVHGEMNPPGARHRLWELRSDCQSGISQPPLGPWSGPWFMRSFGMAQCQVVLLIQVHSYLGMLGIVSHSTRALQTASLCWVVNVYK